MFLDVDPSKFLQIGLKAQTSKRAWVLCKSSAAFYEQVTSMGEECSQRDTLCKLPTYDKWGQTTSGDVGVGPQWTADNIVGADVLPTSTSTSLLRLRVSFVASSYEAVLDQVQNVIANYQKAFVNKK